MVARIATGSRNGRPHVNPLYFVCRNGKIYLGTVDRTLAALNVKADPRVTNLFNIEREPNDRRVLRIRGRAKVRTDSRLLLRLRAGLARARGGVDDDAYRDLVGRYRTMAESLGL
jgi:general stress protein 26